MRDTTHCAPLPPAQRLNRFPATPMCCLLWTVAGDVEAAAPGPDLLHVRMPPALFSGPRGYPLVSYNPGPVHSFMVMLYPAALHALTSIDMAALFDQVRPLEPLFDADWLALSDAVLAAPDDAARIALVEAFLAPRWALARRAATTHRRIQDWVRRLGVRRHLRAWQWRAHIERRIKWGRPAHAPCAACAARNSVFFSTHARPMLQGMLQDPISPPMGGYADQTTCAASCAPSPGLTPPNWHAPAAKMKVTGSTG